MVEVYDFFATWCGPCHAMKPLVAEMEKLFEGKIKFSIFDVDQEGAKAAQFGVQSIPTYIVLKEGKEVDRKLGAMTRENFKNWLEAQLK